MRTEDLRFSMPVPLSMIGFVVKLLPQRLFERLREDTPEPYRDLVTKECITIVLTECLDVLRENKGLEILHVEAGDGTFVSIRL